MSSRIVVARLKSAIEGSKYSHPVFITVVSVYAPTHRSSQERKDEFYQDLQDTISGVNEDDVLMIVCDFNARVGSSDSRDDMWYGIRGLHGVGRMNESGEALLSFCALNELVIMNTMFEKRNIHKFTWQHPGSKRWHCIDYIILRQKDRRLCCDVSVIRNADCWTDHKLVRAQFNFKRPVRVATRCEICCRRTHK